MDSSIWVATTTGMPRRRAARTSCFWTTGTSSGASSTPRSPLATMIAWERSRISSRASNAEGFSILASTLARPCTRLRSSAMSEARCTKDSATQSTPCWSAKARSVRSLSVSAGIGMARRGRFRPLWSESWSPASTTVSAKSGPCLTTRSRTLPSSSRTSAPVRRAAKISGWGTPMREASPGADFRSSRRWWPAFSRTAPSANSPSRSFGPCRSASTAMGRPTRPSTSRTASMARAWSSCEPWLKLTRKTSAPAIASSRILSTPRLAGPRVATIRALRARIMDEA